ncbi:MAG TPA: heparan-alpha-glucosaminide N-acetyltransferase domain-containing protein [Bacteroidota bacterium]|nr:heparan-alpha-glucosaminide N-acetyltransferase domain-containing protein [Bacteroidota bacterium]
MKTARPSAGESTTPGTMAAKPERLGSVDLLRGMVMALMALDHVRDYFTDARFYPLDLTQTNILLYMTRWITHFCAPAFVFLAGTGAFLSLTRGKTIPELSRFLFTRGLWLVFIELTVVRFGWLFNIDYTLAIGQVIWAIGWSMVALAVLIRFPVKVATIFGLLMIALHNLFDDVTPDQLGIFGWPWQILHAGGPINYMQGYSFLVAYPLIPWIGVMAVGYGFGTILIKEASARRKTLLRLGLAITAGFILIRATNLYGDPNQWSQQKDVVFTAFDFINCEKYPPSLLYLMITLGPAIAVLPLLERARGWMAQFFIVFGRVPMFFYIIHIPLIHGLALLAAYLTGYDTGFMFGNVPPWEWPPGYGFGLPVVYVVWGGVVLALYPVCKWFAEVKKRRKDVWLSYL